MQGFALNDIFKIGIGPSSSHTMGPMHAAQHFLSGLDVCHATEPYRIEVTLHGSLSQSGRNGRGWIEFFSGQGCHGDRYRQVSGLATDAL